MNELITWLRAQLDTDEQIASAAERGPWRVDDESYAESIYSADDTAVVSGGRWGGEASVFNETADALHIANNDPARVLHQVQAHRAILDEAEYWGAKCETDPDYPAVADRFEAIMAAVRALVSIYSDREGFDSAWMT